MFLGNGDAGQLTAFNRNIGADHAGPAVAGAFDRIGSVFQLRLGGFFSLGLIQGLEFNSAVGPVITNALLEQHLVLISAGANIIRFVPPLVIEKADVEEMVVRLKAAIKATVK